MNEIKKDFDSETNAKAFLPEGMVSAEEIEAKRSSTLLLRRLQGDVYLSVAGFSCTLFVSGASALGTAEMLLNESERFQNDLAILGTVEGLCALTVIASAYMIRRSIKNYSKAKTFLSSES